MLPAAPVKQNLVIRPMCTTPVLQIPLGDNHDIIILYSSEQQQQQNVQDEENGNR